MDQWKSKISLVAVLLLLVSHANAKQSCAKLTSLVLPGAAITRAELVEAGTFKTPKPPPPYLPPNIYDFFQALPSFCRVSATLKPTTDSNIKIEVWLPSSTWNGKFQGTGNPGWAGEIFYLPLGQSLARGYATANTDTGHETEGASFALGHPEKMVDFGYRAIHEMTITSKAIIAAFYGTEASRSYFSSCSTGGKQALTEAQRFPLDYDGIIAGSPSHNWTHELTGDAWAALALSNNSASNIPEHKLALLHQAVMNSCDALDGLKDGVIDDPTRCTFDPQALLCKDDAAEKCLTQAQVVASRKIYSGAVTPRTGQQIYPGLARGSELGWGLLKFAAEDAASQFKYIVFRDPNWDINTLNFDSDIALAEKMDNGVLTAMNPDLSKFIAHGGELILYQGWADQFVAPQNTINYYKEVLSALGSPEQAANSLRLYMAPGMGHCGGGAGPNEFDVLTPLEQWVEQSKAPQRIAAIHRTPSGKVNRSRPLCPYPQIAKYTGTGSTDDERNFVCKAPAT
jgi:feruloyl esterase